MSGNYLLGTSILIELFARDANVLALLEKAENTYISSIALGELHYGARKSSQTEKNLEQLEQLASQVVILPCDAETSYWYGIVKDGLKKRESPSRKMMFGSQQWLYSMDSHLQHAINTFNQWKS